MKQPARLTWKPITFVIGWLVLAGLGSGCKTTFRTVDERFMAQPAAHRHVQVLPVWFEGAGNIDHTLTTNDLQALCRQANNDLVRAVQRELQLKGYAVVGRIQVLHAGGALSQPVAEIVQPLEAVHADFCENLLAQFPPPTEGQPLIFQTNTTLGFFRYMATWDHARLEHNPFHYQMTASLTNVLFWMGATNVEAVLLVDTKAFFESDCKQTKRTIWNWTGGGLIAVTEVGINVAFFAVAVLAESSSPPPPLWVDPFWHSDNSLQHSIALVDVHTHEVLWLNRQEFKHQDPRDAQILADTVAGTLADLPPISPISRRQIDLNKSSFGGTSARR
jgi:hypothetical protein